MTPLEYVELCAVGGAEWSMSHIRAYLLGVHVEPRARWLACVSLWDRYLEDRGVK